ncbi:unnamed protein product [Oikopleura dioica]|uniref:Tantalus-like domain-containing protein n=1 Tax=Oikopleura dioica TaxID=34765 RepID=E4YLS9_OIKDI|nr:unnamed protein product [Oikopleura dioica]
MAKEDENNEPKATRKSSRVRTQVRTYHPAGDYTDVAVRMKLKASKKKIESVEDIYTQKLAKTPVIASKALATIAENESPDPFSKTKRKRLVLFPTDPALRKPRKRKITEGIKRAAKIQKLSLGVDTEKLLKEKLEQLGKDLEGIEE